MALGSLLLVATLAHLVASQARYNFNNAGSAGGPVFVGTFPSGPFGSPQVAPNQPLQPGVGVPGADGTFAGIPTGPAVGQSQFDGNFVPNPSGPVVSQPEFDGSFAGFPSGQSQFITDGNFLAFPTRGPSGPFVPASFQGVIPAGSTFQGAAGTGTSGIGVLTLPQQGGSGFLEGQGGSFVGAFGSQGGDRPQDSNGQINAQGRNIRFPTSVIPQPIIPTVTQTSTVDEYTTLSDLVLHSVPVTQTQFTLLTTTQVTRVAVPTPVDDSVGLSTVVVERPSFVTLTETSSAFRVVVRSSVTNVGLTHTAYSVAHVPFTITATQTVRVTSTIVRTVISTSVKAVTDYRTVAHTVYVHGYA